MSSHIDAVLDGRGGTDVRFARGRAGRSGSSPLLRSRSCVVTSALSHEGVTITSARDFWPSGLDEGTWGAVDFGEAAASLRNT